jgi:phospholipase C
VIVSPYARPDFVLHDVLDHTSVLKLIEEKWNLAPLTRRDAAAVSPLGALDLDAPPAFLTPPDLPAPKAGAFRSAAAQGGQEGQEGRVSSGSSVSPAGSQRSARRS